MERNVQLTLAGVVIGIAIAALWPPARPSLPPEPVLEAWAPRIELVPPGHRGLVLDAAGLPARFLDVHVLDRVTQRVHRSVRTNFEGHFPIDVPPGHYRVTGLFIDQAIEVPEREHPDIRIQIVPRPLQRFLGTAP